MHRMTPTPDVTCNKNSISRGLDETHARFHGEVLSQLQG